VRGRRGGAADAVGFRLGADPRKGMTAGVPPVGDTQRGGSAGRLWPKMGCAWAARLSKQAGLSELAGLRWLDWAEARRKRGE
jgi:hypothetical protein